MEINPALAQIEFVEHPIITDTQFEFRPSLKPLVGKMPQSCSHLIHLALDSNTDWFREGIKCLGKRGRPYLERGSHGFIVAGVMRIVLPQSPRGIGRVGL